MSDQYDFAVEVIRYGALPFVVPLTAILMGVLSHLRSGRCWHTMLLILFGIGICINNIAWMMAYWGDNYQFFEQTWYVVFGYMGQASYIGIFAVLAVVYAKQYVFSYREPVDGP